MPDQREKFKIIKKKRTKPRRRTLTLPKRISRVNFNDDRNVISRNLVSHRCLNRERAKNLRESSNSCQRILFFLIFPPQSDFFDFFFELFKGLFFFWKTVKRFILLRCQSRSDRGHDGSSSTMKNLHFLSLLTGCGLFCRQVESRFSAL
jgi:hypothetical protein